MRFRFLFLIILLMGCEEVPRAPIGEMTIHLIDEATSQSVNKEILIQMGTEDLSVQTGQPFILAYGDYKALIDNERYEFTIGLKKQHANVNINPPSYVTAYQVIEGQYVYEAVDIPVIEVRQKPELPNGCEITALSSLMTALGIHVDKLTLTTYLPMKDFQQVNGKRQGPDPEDFFVGDPSKSSGWYCFEGPIIEAGNQYLNGKYALHRSSDIIETLNKGHALAVWTTLDMSSMKYGRPWILENQTTYTPLTNLHCIVVYGYDKHDYLAMDPLKGFIRIERQVLNKSFLEMGSRAVYIK